MRQKLFVLLAMMFVGFTSCYDHTEIIDRLNDHEQRIRTLETLCAQMNTSISSLQTIVDALKQNDYVVSVAPIKYGDQEVGYSIIFTSGKTITIYHGKDGKDGADGTNGTNGVNGSTPQIGVKKFTDGVYYWTLNGEWILDDAGEKIRVTGRDGQTIDPGYYVARKHTDYMDGLFDNAFLYTINNSTTTSQSVNNGLIHVEVDTNGIYTITLESPVVNARYVGPLN